MGIAKAVFPREVIAELEQYGVELKVGTVIVIRGVIFRQTYEDGQTAFIINECPRLVLSEVTGIIGEPVPMLKAVSQHKYQDYHLKYSSDEFSIPFKSEFRDKYLQKPK